MSRSKRRFAELQTLPLFDLPTSSDTHVPRETSSSSQAFAEPDSTTWESHVGEGLTAPVKLPKPEAMTVELGPINLIDRLNEYQSDENLLHTVVGLLVGAVLGIVGQWATDSDTPISRTSIILVIVLGLASVGTVLWLLRIRKRKIAVKDRLMGR